MNRLAWVVPSIKTGLGKYTESVKEILKDFYNLDIFVGETGFDINELSGYKNIVYNFGNSRESIPLYLAIKKYPGIAILHDRTYHHFFANYYFEYINKPELYYEILNRIYGEDVSLYANMQKKNGILIWETEDCLKYHMRELIYPYTTAIIVHSKNFSELIKMEYSGEVKYIPLPICKSFSFKDRQKKTYEPDGKIKLISYGFISENRMIEEVLRVIGQTPEIRERIIYIIAGSIHNAYMNKIKSLIEDYGLDTVVKITGFLKDEELYKYIEESDICINLRRYNTEGASWSLLEQMLFGKAVIVFDNGFFSEFPDNVLIKIRRLEDLNDKIHEILSNPSLSYSIGTISKKYILENFKIEDYVKEFANFLDITAFSREKKMILCSLMKDIVDSLPAKQRGLISENLLNEISENIEEIFYRKFKT
ncbi:MAG: glycosyltransferase [Thermodesulfovibrio sp.]|nr:glycosyltransferase [Thermodesulfovibrio sp.]